MCLLHLFPGGIASVGVFTFEKHVLCDVLYVQFSTVKPFVRVKLPLAGDYHMLFSVGGDSLNLFKNKFCFYNENTSDRQNVKLFVVFCEEKTFETCSCLNFQFIWNPVYVSLNIQREVLRTFQLSLFHLYITLLLTTRVNTLQRTWFIERLVASISVNGGWISPFARINVQVSCGFTWVHISTGMSNWGDIHFHLRKLCKSSEYIT